MKTVYAPTTALPRVAVVAVALAAAAGGLAVAALISAVSGTFSFTVSILAVLLAAWYGDLAAGLLATSLIAVVTPLLVPALRQWGPDTADSAMRLLLQVLISVAVTVLVSRVRAAERRYRLIVETAAEGIWTVDAAGCTTFVNRRMAELLGYEIAEMIGRPFADFMPPAGIDEATRAFDALRAGARRFDECELLRKDGSSRWVLYSATPIRDGDAFRGALSMVADISDRKRAEEIIRQQAKQLEQANRAKDEFFTTLSHELRTPLNAILGCSDMLLRMKVDAAAQQRMLERINRAAHAESMLLRDILDVSRIVGGKLRLDMREVDLAAVVHAAIDVVRPAADAKRITLDVAAQPPALLVGDPDRLQQIVWNLLSNSIKFTPADGRIEVAVARVGSRLDVVVRDTGIGIPEEFLPHVFERFRQHESGTHARGGLGLGLAIARHLVELHGGTVRATSEGAGKGATFAVSLPVRALIEPAAGHVAHSGQATGQQHHAVSLQGLHVLVVDDDEDARMLLRTTLESSGARVSVASSAFGALDAIARERPHLLIADIGMPEVDGHEMLRRIRALPADRGGAIVAVALTAYAGPDERARALDAGFNDYLTKPVTADALLAVIASIARVT